MNPNFSEYAQLLGRLQHEGEALIAANKDCQWNTKDIRAVVLPLCTRNGLNSRAFEYLAGYLCKKYANDYQD